MAKMTIKILIIILSVIIILCAVAMIGIHLAHSQVFSRADYDEYDIVYFNTYGDLDAEKYPRELLKVKSGENMLTAYLYGQNNTQGLIIVSPGHRDANDVKLPEITYFIDAGWMVLCYDYTGCYNSDGDSMVGYTQAPTDLHSILTFVESDIRFENIPVMLFGHSLGAYASAAVLKYQHNIKAVVAASGFDIPREQWKYSVQRFTGIFGKVLNQFAGLYMDIRFKDLAKWSAVDNINSTEIPILVISGTADEFYGGLSKIYERKDKITNPNCEFMLMNKINHHGHYDYFLSDAAISYKEQIAEGIVKKPIDKALYIEHDIEFMEKLNQFYIEVLR